MQKFIFWREWPASIRFFYGLLLVTALIAAVLVLYFDFAGVSALIGWDTLARTETLSLPIQQFRVSLFEFTTEVDSALFWQYFDGSRIQVNLFSYYLFLILSVLCILLLITVITDLKGFWYFVGASLLVVVLVNYKFELIYLFGRDDKTGLALAFILYLPLTYYFNRINSTWTFMQRFLIFLFVTLIFGLIIFFFAEVDMPFFYLVTSGVFNPLIISLVFILMISHEIMVSLMFVITSTNRLGSGKNLNHFLIISGIYLVNLILAYMYEAHIIDWDLIYVNLFILLLISAIAGIWGYRQREQQYNYLFNFKPTGAVFYIAMFFCCLVTIAHFQATANDPAIEVFRDVIIYSHLGFGLIFLIYVLANFITPLGQNLPVHKILFNPTRMPYFTFRLAGFITFLAFIFAADIQVPVRQSTAAYYNGLGDMYAQSGEWVFAQRYYEEGAIYGYNNHKSNYALGNFHFDRKDYGKAGVHYEKAIRKQPTPQSFINLSNTYLDSDRFFEALFTLRQGQKIFPENYQIKNNLGLIYNKTSLLDSAFYFLDQATRVAGDNDAAGSNVIGLLTKNVIDVNIDSVLEAYANPEDPITLNNTLVWKNANFQSYDYAYAPPDSSLSYLEGYLLYNSALNYLYKSDSMDTRWLNQYVQHPSNLAYRDNLEKAMAFNLYKNHQVNRAFRMMNWVGNRNQIGNGESYVYVGKWAMAQQAPDVATDYFTWAVERQTPGSTYLLGIALSENHNIEQARSVWQEILEIGDENAATLAAYMLRLYSMGMDDYTQLSDESKYHFVHFNLARYDSSNLSSMVRAIEEPNVRARAVLDISKHLFERDQILPAIQWFDQLSGESLSDEVVFQQIQWYELQLLAAQDNIRGLARKINDGMTFSTENLVEKQYYTALIQLSSGDTLNARQNFEWLAYSNPFHEEATIAAADYISKKDPFEGYDILLGALEINPRSIKILKAYILQAARLQFNNYALISLETLKPLLTPQEFNSFFLEYQRTTELAGDDF